MGGVVQFPYTRGDGRGVVHVMGDGISGFEIGHESASGNSWGSFSTYASGEEAITATFALNRDSMAAPATCSSATPPDRTLARTSALPQSRGKYDADEPLCRLRSAG